MERKKEKEPKKMDVKEKGGAMQGRKERGQGREEAMSAVVFADPGLASVLQDTMKNYKMKSWTVFSNTIKGSRQVTLSFEKK